MAESLAKVFVGNLPLDFDEVEVRERFKQHGVIQEVKCLRNFCFVQFATPEMAQAAISAERGQQFRGKVLQVDLAKAREGGKGARGDTVSGCPGLMGAHQAGPGFAAAAPPSVQEGFGHLMQGGQTFPAAAPMPGRGAGPPRPRPPAPPPSTRAPAGGGNKACDCEIVCVNRSSSLYCESVETRLRAMGMTVDVLFPTPGVQLRKILENIISRGVAYAVLVTPENEQNGTVTVNKLQGQQSEKLNIPADAAVRLLASDFGGGRQVEAAPSGGDDVAKSSRPVAEESGSRRTFPGGGHPADVMTVVDFLLDNRPLSVMEYDKLIRYLSMRREEMLRREYGDDIPAHLLTPAVGAQASPELRAKEEEFKVKILDILSRPKEDEQRQQREQWRPQPYHHSGQSHGQPDSSSIAPSLQSAIDSLFKGAQVPKTEEGEDSKDKDGPEEKAFSGSASDQQALFSGY